MEHHQRRISRASCWSLVRTFGSHDMFSFKVPIKRRRGVVHSAAKVAECTGVKTTQIRQVGLLLLSTVSGTAVFRSSSSRPRLLIAPCARLLPSPRSLHS